MKFTLPKIKKLIKQSLTMAEIGHPLMDSQYNWYRTLTGHENPYYRLFYLIAKELKPQFVVELGSYRAVASGHFAVGNPQCEVVTVDFHKDMPAQESDRIACVHASRVIPNLTFISKCSIDTIPGFDCALNDITALNKPIDILFIDAWHREDYVKREWDLYSPLLADEALVICDDLFDNAGQFPGMERWWDSFKYQKFLNNEVHPGIPMGFLKFTRKNTKRGRPKEK